MAEEQPQKNADIANLDQANLEQAIKKEGDEEDIDAKQLGVSPSKASYLRKLSQGVSKNIRSRSQLLNGQTDIINAANSADGDRDNAAQQFPEDPFVRGAPDLRNMTQENFGNRENSTKQSVLVKRVNRDGVVVSGLDRSMADGQNEDDQGTLGSQGGQTIARESNIVNYEVNDGSVSRLRSTMYITGQNKKKYALKNGQQKSKGSPSKKTNPSIGRTMIINLGDRTQTNFANSRLEEDHNMVVGVTDIATGQSHVQHPSKKNFNPKLQPKRNFHGRSGSQSQLSAYDEPGQAAHNLYVNTQNNQTNIQSSELLQLPDEPGTATQGMLDASIESQRNVDMSLDHPIHDRRHHDELMMISSLSPGLAKKAINKLRAPTNMDSQNSQGALNFDALMKPTVEEPLVNSRFSKPAKAEVVVRNVDARSMIPAQHDDAYQKRSPRQKTKRFGKLQPQSNKSPTTAGISSLGTRQSPTTQKRQQLNSDLQIFHQEQAKQYKDFIKKNLVGSKQRSRLEGHGSGHHDQSQSTLLDQVIHEDGDGYTRMDHSVEMKPGQVNQGTQPSEMMFRSLEDQLIQFKQETNDSFYKVAPNQKQYMHEVPSMTATKPEHVKMMETVKQPNTTHTPTPNITHEPFKLSEGGKSINSKMLSTYRGNDNMKIKAIDKSVLRTHGAGSNASSKAKHPLADVTDDDNSKFILQETMREPLRKSIIQDLPHLEEANYNLYENQNLSPYESKVMLQASPLSKIESYRALLRQESNQNDFRIMQNIDNFRNLINPEITKKGNFSVTGQQKPADTKINLGHVQNVKLLHRKDDMLHTVTSDFLKDNYPTTRDKATAAGPIKAYQRINVDPSEFRAQLAKKIEELHRIETNQDYQSPSRRSDEDSLKAFMINNKLQELQADAALDNHPFMTFLQQSADKKDDILLQTTGNAETPPLLQTLPDHQRLKSFEQDAAIAQAHLAKVETEGDYIQTTSQLNADYEVRSYRKLKNQDSMSFAGRRGSRSGLPRERSNVSLARSNSNATIKRISRRYMRDHKIAIFEDGFEISDKSPCYVIELNSLLRRYYLQQNGSSQYTTHQEDINTQVKMYERAVKEILDQCGSRLFFPEDLTPEQITELDGAAPKIFNTLYTVYGETIQSLIQIDEEACILIAGDKNVFHGLKTSALFKHSDAAGNFLDRVVANTSLNFTKKNNKQTTFANRSVSTVVQSSPVNKLESPFKRPKQSEPPGITFDLTQARASPSNKNYSAMTTPKRYGSQTPRDIIKETKQELIDQLVVPREKSNLRARLNNMQSGRSSSMRAQRLAQIALVTKGIKKGRLPPIKTPKQLDVFVFGEKGAMGRNKGSATIMLKNHLDRSNGITGPMTNSNVDPQRARNVSVNVTDYSEHHIKRLNQDSALYQELDQQVAETLKKKRGTQFPRKTSGQSLLEQIKQDGSITNLSAGGGNVQGSSDLQIAELLDTHESMINTVPGMENLKNNISTDLKMTLEAVHSVQQITHRAGSTGSQYSTHQQQQQQYVEQSIANQEISAANIKVAKMALRERSPSYHNSKLVSQTSLQNDATRAAVQSQISRKQQEKLDAEVNEHVLQNALQQRSKWRIEHQLNDQQLFQLFSEFSSMMQIGRIRVNDADPKSLKNRLQDLNKAAGSMDDKLNRIFPIGPGLSSTKYNLMRQAEKHRNYKLNSQDMKDFRVAVQVCADYSVVLRPTKERLRLIVLEAMGVSTSLRDAKISYDQFLKVNSFLFFNHGEPDDYIWFVVRLFDPKLTGFTSVENCERVIDLLFDNQNEGGDTTKPPKVNLPDKVGKRVEIKSQPDNASSIVGDAEDELDEQTLKVNDSANDANSNGNARAEQESDGQQKGSSLSITAGGGQATPDAVTAESMAGNSVKNGGDTSVMSSRAKKSSSLANKNSSKGARNRADLDKDEGVASNIKKICYEKGIFKEDGYLDSQAMFDALKEGVLDMESFMSSLK